LREVIFSHAFTAKVKKFMKNPAAPQSTGGGSASPLGAVASAKAPKTVRVIAEGEDFRRRIRSYVFQRVDDNAFHQFRLTLTAEAGESPAALIQA
jgi:hypothetical protein